MPVGEHLTPLIAAKPRIHTKWKTKYTVLQIIGLAFTAIVLLFVLISFGYIVTGQGELKDIIDKTNEIAVEEQKLKQSVNNANSANNNNNKVITGNTNKIQNIACGGGDSGAVKKILFEDNFFDGFEPGYFIGSKWICVSDDGKVRVSESNDPWIPFDSKKKKLIIEGIPTSAGIYGSSKPFLKPITTTSSGGSSSSENLNYMYGGDNNKLFYFVNQRFNLVGGTKFVAEVNISGAVYSGDDIPPLLGITSQDNDPRVASIVFSTFDDETQLQNDFLLTNTTIYAASWRHPFRREQSPAHRVSSDDGIDYYASYRYLYPLKRRSSPEDVHTLQIVYDKTISSDFLKTGNDNNNDSIPVVRWFIDGKELLTISNLGAHQSRNYMTMDLGGNTRQQSVNPKRIKVGLGTASYLQMYSTCEQKVLTAPQSYECIYKDAFAPIALPLPLRFKYFNPRNTTIKNFTAKVDTLDITQNETTFGQGADFYLLGISIYQLTPVVVA